MNERTIMFKKVNGFPSEKSSKTLSKNNSLEKAKNTLANYGLEIDVEYNVSDVISKLPFELKGVQKTIWNLIKGIAEKLSDDITNITVLNKKQLQQNFEQIKSEQKRLF